MIKVVPASGSMLCTAQEQACIAQFHACMQLGGILQYQYNHCLKNPTEEGESHKQMLPGTAGLPAAALLQTICDLHVAACFL